MRSAKPCLPLALAVLILVGLLPRPAAAGVDCLQPEADCRLRDWADQAGFFVGAAEGALASSAGYDDALATHFNSLTAENALKWSPLSPSPRVFDFTRSDRTIDFAEANGMRVRGHTLVWARLNGPPPWLEGELAAAKDPAARLEELIDQHIAVVVGRYAGRIPVWDVVNEPLELFGPEHDASSIFYQTLGDSYIARAFAAAHAADPDAKLFLNETLAEFVDRKFEGLVELVEMLVEDGVPVHGVGLQGHFIERPDFTDLRGKLAAISDLGLDVELTEVDVPIVLFEGDEDPLLSQADAYQVVFAACLAVERCTGITVWGVDDGHTWLDDFAPEQAPNRPLLLDESFAVKPAWEGARRAIEAHLVPEPGREAGAVAVLMAVAVSRRSGARARGASGQRTRDYAESSAASSP